MSYKSGPGQQEVRIITCQSSFLAPKPYKDLFSSAKHIPRYVNLLSLGVNFMFYRWDNKNWPGLEEEESTDIFQSSKNLFRAFV